MLVSILFHRIYRPYHLTLKTVERGSENDINHPVYPLIHHPPNPETTAFEFWQMIWVNYLLTGYGYGYKKRNGAGDIVELWNIPTNAVQPSGNTQTGEKFYVVTDETAIRQSITRKICIACGECVFNQTNGVVKFIEVAREALGLSIAAEEFGRGISQTGRIWAGLSNTPAL